MKEKFFKDLQTLYEEIERRDGELNGFYEVMKSPCKDAQEVIDEFLRVLSLPKNDDTVMASLIRIVNLREDALEQVLKKEGMDEEEIIRKKEKAYLFVSDFHMKRHSSLIEWIEKNSLFTPFYRTLIRGVHEIGKAMSGWQSAWTSHVIYGVNRELFSLFNGDEEKIRFMLFEKGLLDCDENGEIGDRCYSVLRKREDGEYESVPYAKAFKDEVERVLGALDSLIENLKKEKDEVFFKKSEWLLYLNAIKKALRHTERDELISYWAKVDEAWMEIDTPLQIGHPLEYYEDHYRKAVALEWDLRIVNPKLQEAAEVREDIKRFLIAFSRDIHYKFLKVLSKNIEQIDKTQLYIGRPMLYYGAEFNGLFSAQVVPNDEEVSSKLGKKIFAYADFVRESKLSKPVMQLSVEIMGEEFVKKQRRILEEFPSLWYKVYEISTIGHEFGHILWMDNDTEVLMNESGQFKNIEEFKATSGGLLAFFYNEKEELKEHIVDDLVSRAVSLMSWREVGEVLPYYCEGIIHLEILFSCKAVSFDGKIKIDYSKYDLLKEKYVRVYKELVNAYLMKRDAFEFLSAFAEKRGGYFLPVTEKVREFVEFYYERYKEIGQKIVS